MRVKLGEADVLKAVRQLLDLGANGVSAPEVHAEAGGSPATIGRHLQHLVAAGDLVRQGRARATRYFLRERVPDDPAAAVTDLTRNAASPAWSRHARAVLKHLAQPLGAREPVGYERQFVDNYRPNQSLLLPPALAEALAAEGATPGQQPAGTYARKVLEQLLVDLSWSSSRLEGNTYSLLATEELFKSGGNPVDQEGVMLLNHKRAIEFLVDAVPHHGLTDAVLCNVHSLLMDGLLPSAGGLGTVRAKVVNIADTTYVPPQMPQLLREMLDLLVHKARLIKNPVEAAFFLWINLAYLQPFEDGNKRTSRLAANIPLLLYNRAPLAFLDVAPADYAKAMLGVCELRDLTIATELFAWTSLDVAIPAGHNAFVYLYQGSLLAPVTQQVLAAGHMAILSAAGDGVTLRSEEGARVLVLAGKPLQESIAQYGPFVMNTRAELEQAFDDYQQGRLA